MKEPKIELNGWQTIADYAKARGLSTQAVSMRVRRGSLLVRECPELNGLRLVREAGGKI